MYRMPTIIAATARPIVVKSMFLLSLI